MPIDRRTPCVNRGGNQLTIEQAERALDEAAAIIIGIAMYPAGSDMDLRAAAWVGEYSPQQEIGHETRVAMNNHETMRAITGRG